MSSIPSFIDTKFIARVKRHLSIDRVINSGKVYTFYLNIFHKSKNLIMAQTE